MAVSKLVAMLFDAWDDLDRASEGVTAEEATAQPEGGSSFGWTLRHLAGGLDFWVNTQLRGGSQHPTFAAEHAKYEFSGACGDWDAIAAAARDVRRDIESYLRPLSEDDLATIEVPGQGPYPAVSLRYMVSRSIAHTYFHIGEVATKRGLTGDFPGPLPNVIE